MRKKSPTNQSLNQSLEEPNSNPLDEIHALMEQAAALPLGNAQMELLERAVALSDVLGDVQAGFATRDALVYSASMSGNPQKTLVAFAWQLAQWDKLGQDGLGISEFHLLWSYKWVINGLFSIPSVAMTQVEAVLNDFRERLERAGHSLGIYHQYRLRWTMHRGEPLEAAAIHLEFKQFDSSGILNCVACHLQQEVSFQRFMGQFEAVLQAAKPLLRVHMPPVATASQTPPMQCCCCPCCI